MNKKQIKKQDHVSMEKFLRNYVGIKNEKVLEWLINLTHREIKEICDEVYLLDLTRISFESVTKEDLKTGEVILVLDKDSNPAPYVNPSQNELDVIMDDIIESKCQELYNIENHMQTFDDYTDDLDEIALDENVDCQKLKVLSKTMYRGSDFK